MNAFDLSRYIEQQGMLALGPLLESYADGGHFTVINKGPLVSLLQATVGDVLLNRRGGCYALEIKIDGTDNYGNFFLETWSNKKFQPRRLGWMYTLSADIFWYYFRTSGLLYSLDFHRLWNWAFTEPQKSVAGGRGRIYDYPEKIQRKFDQMNETWGRCVPISAVINEIGCAVYRPHESLEPELLVRKEWNGEERDQRGAVLHSSGSR